ncbi:hypothetical protein HY634_02545 [Candidatus Uhrbacteria bacterium]|nr:hypothetical protein [Candidatus Uhrbacteria bacterium]
MGNARTFIIPLTLTALVLGSMGGAGGASAAERRVVFNEVDSGYAGDAPNEVGSAQDAPVLEPGLYGTTLVSQSETETVYQGPSLASQRDADVYKITVLPGVRATFTVTPHNGQDMFIRMYNADGREVADHHYNAGNRRAAGFAETVTYLKGLHLSREEDGEVTVYVLVKRNGGNKVGRYSIDYEEANANDATWTTDAADSLLRAPRVGWGQRYEGYLGYGDKADCFQLDAATAVGKKVTIRVTPLDTALDTALYRTGGATQASYWNANGQPLHLLTAAPMRIGSREYKRDEITKAATDGGVGFADDQVIYPYYARAGTSGSDAAYICVRLKSGAGRYEFTLAHEDAPLAAASPTDADKADVTLPPGAPVAPELPPIRMKKTATIIGALPTSGGATTNGTSMTGSNGAAQYRIGETIPSGLRDAAKEKKAIATFKKIYRRAPNLRAKADRAAVDAIAYGLKAKKVDAKAERNATNRFRAIFKRAPKGAADLAILRAMTYAGVKK